MTMTIEKAKVIADICDGLKIDLVCELLWGQAFENWDTNEDGPDGVQEGWGCELDEDPDQMVYIMFTVDPDTKFCKDFEVQLIHV